MKGAAAQTPGEMLLEMTGRMEQILPRIRPPVENVLARWHRHSPGPAVLVWMSG